MKNILIVDDDIKIVHFLKGIVSRKLHLPVKSARSMKEVQQLLAESSDFAVALVDIRLPDAKNAECVDLVLDSQIPVIVMSDENDSEFEREVRKKDILEYVQKDSASSFDYAIRLLQFVHGFEKSEVLVVDDQASSRLQMKFSLSKLPLVIHEAEDGLQALKQLKNNPRIQLVITDKYMPHMDGLELTKEIRRHYSMDRLSIMGVSASDEPMTSIEFLKNGANDFIRKPFMYEELFSRVINNLEMLYFIQLAEASAVKDFLTGLYNRRYLYDTGNKLYANAKREQLSMVVAMLDIDHFKKINDRYGHEAGDLALKMLGRLMLQEFRNSDVLTRYGGEEFCILLTNTDLRYAVEHMQRVCKKVEEMVIQSHTISFRMTLSVGLNADMGNSFDEMISLADDKLYQAKGEGRNRVVY